ncbi:hypothetical protein J25TS5_16970 [Paenibacillus faecis]|uniref:DUF6773 family protein n=1 Tax=Paenibacillus faecis TaxID=862114 RepID=UPI001AFD5EAF|nr:DUF6773 family protein [Paenibacillus faecis]GIO84765.1 hypothetical protein J25TS5_16970 [Paenibacillus faecis]
MNWFNKNKLTDERIVNLKNQIYREAYLLITIICSASIILKIFLQEAPSTLTEVIVLLAGGIYYGVRSVMLGIYSEEVEVHDRESKTPYSRKTVWSGLAIGLGIALFFGIRSALLYGKSDLQTQVWYFFLVFAVSLIIYLPFFIAFQVTVHHWANKASKKFAESDLRDPE